ncbi:hypothetical protein ABPG72_015479 [Tetrahymena utriculariae]
MTQPPQSQNIKETNEQIQMKKESDKSVQYSKQLLCNIYQLSSQILNVIYSQKEFREQKLKKIQFQEKVEEFMSFGLIIEQSVSIENIELQLKEIQINLDQILNSKNKFIEELQKRQTLLRQQNQLFQSKIMMLIKNHVSKRRLSEQNNNERQIISELQNLDSQQKPQINQRNNLSSSNVSISTLGSIGGLSFVQEESFDNLETLKVVEKQNSPPYQHIIQQLDAELDLDFLKIKQYFQNNQQTTHSEEANMFFSDRILKLSRQQKSEENYICLDKNDFYVFKDLQKLKQNKRFPIKDITKITISSHDQCEIQINKQYSLIISISKRQLLINYIFSIFQNILKVKPPHIQHSQVLIQKNMQSSNLYNSNLIQNSQISLNELSTNQLQTD